MGMRKVSLFKNKRFSAKLAHIKLIVSFLKVKQCSVHNAQGSYVCVRMFIEHFAFKNKNNNNYKDLSRI